MNKRLFHPQRQLLRASLWLSLQFFSSIASLITIGCAVTSQTPLWELTGRDSTTNRSVLGFKGKTALHPTPQLCIIVFLFVCFCLKHLKILFLFFKFIYILAVLGLRCCARASSSCSKWGLLFVVVRRLLLWWSMGSRPVGFSSCSTRA